MPKIETRAMAHSLLLDTILHRPIHPRGTPFLVLLLQHSKPGQSNIQPLTHTPRTRTRPSHFSLALARRSRSAAHSSRLEDHWLYGLFPVGEHLRLGSRVVILGAGRGAAAGSAGSVSSTANTDSLSSAEVGMSSAGEEDRAVTSTSNPTTFSPSTSIVHSAAACWVCNKFDTSVVDTSWVERPVKHRKCSSMTSACGGGGEVESRWRRR